MYRNSLFDNPLAVFLLFLLVCFTNIILSVHFISVLLAGVVFMAFNRCVEKKYYYSLSLVIFTFFIIESSQGLKLLSLSLLSFFIYIFIIPKIKTLLSSISLYTISIILIFYIGIVVLFSLFANINILFLTKLMFNYILDIFIVGILI